MKRFRPAAWTWLVFLPMLALLLSLGTWQVRRAHEKQALLEGYARAARAEPQTLDPGASAPYDVPVSVEASGTYLGDRQLLLDNQSHDGRPGYHVWTPMRLTAGPLIVVDRGWIERPPRADLPNPSASSDAMQIRGLWRALPRPGLRLGAAPSQALKKFPATVEYPTAEDLRVLLGEPVAAGVLLLDPSADAGFVREWNPAGTFPPSRHYGYAAQWFALSAALIVLFIIVNRKPT